METEGGKIPEKIHLKKSLFLWWWTGTAFTHLYEIGKYEALLLSLFSCFNSFIPHKAVKYVILLVSFYS